MYSASHWTTDNQFLYWQMYPLMAIIVISLILEINYLNKTLCLFSTAIVTPVYYVFFTTSTIITSAVLFRGFPISSTNALISILVGFFIIVGGVALLFDYNIRQGRIVSFLDLTSAGSMTQSMIFIDGNNPGLAEQQSSSRAKRITDNIH